MQFQIEYLNTAVRLLLDENKVAGPEMDAGKWYNAKLNKDRGQKEWEDMKARVFSGGQTSDSNDVLSLQGVNAQKAGFGIGMGLDYEDLT